MTAAGAAAVGGLSRGMAACISCPVTVVKTRMEYGGANAYTYSNTLHALGSIARSEGLRGLYRGLGPTMLSNAPFSALYYMFYTRLQVRGAHACSGMQQGAGAAARARGVGRWLAAGG